MPDVEVRPATSKSDVAAVKALFLDYLQFVTDYLGQDLSFQGTEKEFANFPTTYTRLFLARHGENAVGAVGLKLLRPNLLELKRLYVSPEGRGLNLGKRLSQAAINEARMLGYTELYLDTDPGLAHANAIYEVLGFQDVEQYYENPLGSQSRYMRLAL
ncbi:acetyltransferase (GNAT) family protein [Litorimonas taeanensis]|uniref:Acetyltransferase (GNAT) family protein n=1 Tax=Litorimonas taeanensis TaxID=568099 RepID=A0A420WLI6_9PROT|nr:GNAT family N-acetyltransferase [Litorimonas taeanensis]RKQ71839.1 acetyltransferase (GNAT) family protein [Litorimonas taeanensis]